MFLTGTGAHTLENLFKLIGLLVVFVIIIIACYYVTKLVGTNQLVKTKNSNFKILDTYKLGQNQLIAIVEVGNRYFCIGITKENVSLISELDEDDFNKAPMKEAGSFAGVFANVLNKNKGKDKASLDVTDSFSKEESNSEENRD